MTQKRTVNVMSKEIRDVLRSHGLMRAYESRPAYQRNDCLGWIARAKQEETRQKRLNQMLEELEGGNKYMNMKWNAK